MSFGNYGRLCTEVYDFTKPIGHFWGMDHYLERLRNTDGRILEAMAGSGRVLIPLLETGLAVDGIDSSPDMLASCRNRCNERGLAPKLYEGSLLELSLPDTYDAIFIAGASFLLIEDREQSIRALRRLYERLNVRGKIILDLELPDTDFEIGKVKTGTISFPDGTLITIENKLVEVDMFKQYTVNYLKYEKWMNGALLRTELQRFAMRWYGIEEFMMILNEIGFTDIKVCADYEVGKPPSKLSKIFTFEAVKG